MYWYVVSFMWCLKIISCYVLRFIILLLSIRITGSKLSDPLVTTLPSPVIGTFNFDITWTFTVSIAQQREREFK